jgi:hypothetical protein
MNIPFSATYAKPGLWRGLDFKKFELRVGIGNSQDNMIRIVTVQEPAMKRAIDQAECPVVLPIENPDLGVDAERGTWLNVL